MNAPDEAPPRSKLSLWLLVSLTLAVTTASLAQNFSESQAKPAPTAPLIEQANQALEQQDFPTALTLLTALNTRTPNDAHILYDLGFTQDALHHDTEAEAAYRAAITADAHYFDPHLALGLLLARAAHSAAQTQRARAELTLAVTLPADDPALKARAYRALAKLDQTASPPDPAAASSALLEALKLTPETPDDLLQAAELAEASTPPDLPAAERAYRGYLAAVPKDTATIAALAHNLLAQHHPAAAEDLLTTALTHHPGDPVLTAQLAAADLALGDDAHVAQAAPLLETLHTARPEDSNITRLLARVYLETGHPAQADSLYADLISTASKVASQSGNPLDPTLLDNRAEALLRLHRPGEARSLLQQAIASPSAFPSASSLGTAATHLAFACAEIDDPKGALQALQLRSTVLPPTPESLFLEATANDTLHQSSKAVDLYKRFLAVANGGFPEQELQARQRLAALQPKRQP